MKKEFSLRCQTCNRHFGCYLLLMLFLLPAFINAQQITVLKSFKDINGKYGFKNESGQIIIAPKYDRVYDFYGGLAIVSLDKKYGFINQSGKEIISIKYQGADHFKEDMTRIQSNDKWGFIDKTGKEIIPAISRSQINFMKALYGAVFDNKYGFIDKAGTEVIPFEIPGRGYAE